MDPYFQVIHISLGIERFQKNPSLLAKEIGMEINQFQSYLTKLELWNYINVIKQEVQILKRFVHLEKESPLCGPNQQMMRLKSMEQLKKFSHQEKLSFSGTFSAAKKDGPEVMLKITKLLEELRNLTHDSPSERCYQLNIDFHPWTK